MASRGSRSGRKKVKNGDNLEEAKQVDIVQSACVEWMAEIIASDRHRAEAREAFVAELRAKHLEKELKLEAARLARTTGKAKRVQERRNAVASKRPQPVSRNVLAATIIPTRGPAIATRDGKRVTYHDDTLLTDEQKQQCLDALHKPAAKRIVPTAPSPAATRLTAAAIYGGLRRRPIPTVRGGE